MMPARPRSRPLCLVVWVLVPLLSLTILLGIGWPWLDRLGTLEASLATSADQLSRYRRLLQTLPALRAELEQVNANEEFKAFYFDAPTPALAGAELQRRLQDIVQGANGRLISTQLLPSTPGEEPPRVRIRTQLQGSTETLLDILFAIEQARPFLFVDQLSVRSTAQPARPLPRMIPGSRPAAQNPQEGLLTVRLDVFGYALRGDR